MFCLMVTILEPHKIQQNTFSSVYACIFQQPIQSCIRWMSNTKMLFSGKNCISMHIYGKFLHRFLGVLCNINVAYILEFYCCLFVQIQSMKLGLFAPKRFDTVLWILFTKHSLCNSKRPKRLKLFSGDSI